MTLATITNACHSQSLTDAQVLPGTGRARASTVDLRAAAISKQHVQCLQQVMILRAAVALLFLAGHLSSKIRHKHECGLSQLSHAGQRPQAQEGSLDCRTLIPDENRNTVDIDHVAGGKQVCTGSHGHRVHPSWQGPLGLLSGQSLSCKSSCSPQRRAITTENPCRHDLSRAGAHLPIYTRTSQM